MARPSRPWYWKARDGWYVTIQGVRHKLAAGKENRAEALSRFHNLMLLASKSVAVDSDRQTVCSLLEAYLEYASTKLEARSFSEQKAILAQFADAYGDFLVANLKAIHFERWLDAHPQWASPWTQSHVVAVVKRSFNWGVKMDMIPVNPLRNVTRAVGSPRRPLTDIEFAKLMRGAPGPKGKCFRQVLAMLRLTGMRPSEVSAMKWSNIDLEVKAIILPTHKTSKKTHRPRVIPLTKPILRLLEHRRRESKGEFVFVGQRGNPWNHNSLSMRLQRCKKRQGLAKDASLYGLRHRFGTQAIVNGVDLKTLAHLMGHESTRTTEWYVHLSGRRDHLAAAMAQAIRPKKRV